MDVPKSNYSITPLIECIPNFSEGRNKQVIEQIAEAIDNVEHIKLLHVDSNKAANRTVMTFAGPPEAVTEAAYNAIRTATGLIDMRKHTGVHPRLGATDVCPLVPLKDISMSETVVWTDKLAQRVADDLSLPVFLYSHSAIHPDRSNLADIRKGEFEGLTEKMHLPMWYPDYGPALPHPTAGAAVIGARDFLIAYNINLDTQDTVIARKIAQRIRESGVKGNPGLLKSLKAIGWYIEEFGLTQVSTNITDYKMAGLHVVFETCKNLALEMGVRVMGSELVGMIPLQAMLQSGKYYAGPENGHWEATGLINLAIQRLGLSQLGFFDPEERIIEWKMGSVDS